MNNTIKVIQISVLATSYLAGIYFLTDFVADFITSSYQSHFIVTCGLFALMTLAAGCSILNILCGDDENEDVWNDVGNDSNW